MPKQEYFVGNFREENPIPINYKYKRSANNKDIWFAREAEMHFHDWIIECLGGKVVEVTMIKCENTPVQPLQTPTISPWDVSISMNKPITLYITDTNEVITEKKDV